MTFDELLGNFELLGDWESRFSYLIDLGKQLPSIDDKYKCDQYRVHGCQAQVWLNLTPGEDGRVNIVADSDAFIVRGLIAILLLIWLYIRNLPALLTIG